VVVDIMAGIGIFKSIYDSAKALKDINDPAIRNGAVVELQEKILTARDTQTVLLERISSLEKEVADFETWSIESLHYQKGRTPFGSIVFTLKPDANGAEPPHQICAHCYQNRKISFLHRIPRNNAATNLGKPEMLRCPECKEEFPN
jgi:hypothetical protein